MSISNIRLELVTNQLIQKYLQNGLLPDESQVAASLIAMFPTYYNSITNMFNINIPLWQPTDLDYRQTSNVSQWNTTQQSAAQDMTVAYTDLLEDVSSMTSSLYSYINRSNLIKNRITNLQSRIQNLLLISTSTDGFVYSFFDNFIDTSKTSFGLPFTTALVNTSTQNVELPIGPVTSPELVVSDIVNLAYIQGPDISFSILNPVASQQGLSSATLQDIFTNQAVAWQQNITINGIGPLVCELTVNISPLGTALINKIEMFTRMTNYSNELLIQVLTSTDGISYLPVNSPANPQYVGRVAEFNFPPINVAYVKFIITKNTADQGSTYNIGFQYINFQQVTYSLEADFYSIPITMANGVAAINKIALEACTVEPTNTNINYYIIPSNLPGTIPIPISPDTDHSPEFPTVISLGALTNVVAEVSTSSGWMNGRNGSLFITASGLANDSTININESIIPNTITMYRDYGPTAGSGAANGLGWQSNPSGYPDGYFLTYAQVNNPNGIIFDAQGSQAFIDKTLTTGAVTLPEGLHSIATKDYPGFQQTVQYNSDLYFAWISRFVSTFDFFNNISPTDNSVFTYDSSSGNIYCYPVTSKYLPLSIDYSNSFLPSFNGDGTFLSSSVPITPLSFTIPPVNSGTVFDIEVGTFAIWVNEIQGLFTIPIGNNITITVNTSIDNINWITQLNNIPGPIAGISNGSIKFNNPIYTRYIQVIIGLGNTTTITNVLLYAPVFITNETIQTLPIELPTASTWNIIADNFQQNHAQTFSMFNIFADPPSLLFTKGYGTYPNFNINISNTTNPNNYIYLKIKSNSGSYDPYLYNVTLNTLPYTSELSQISFSYNKVGATNIVTSVIFNAHLTSTQPGITPQLQSYRVKML